MKARTRNHKTSRRNTTGFLIAIFATGIAFSTARCEDNVVSIDQKARVLTVDHGGALKAYRFGPYTEVIINGVQAPITQIQAGAHVTITLSDPQTMARIAVGGNPPALSGASPTPFSGFDDTANAIHHLAIKMLEDAHDDVKVRGNRLWIEHVDWALPKDISINGVPWAPHWTNNVTEDFPGFTGPLASFTDKKISVTKLKGRGSVTLIEPPTSKNGQTLTIRFSDKDGAAGADTHEAIISW